MKKFVLILFWLIGSFSFINAQVSKIKDSTEKPVVQFSGIVTEGDSLFGISGALIYVPRTGRGTNSNLIGYFNMPVNRGDSIVIAALGYKRKYLFIPEDTVDGYSYSVVIKLKQDTIELSRVVVNAFPTEEVFKEVFLSMNVEEDKDYLNLQNNLDPQLLAQILEVQELGPDASFNYLMAQQAEIAQRRYAVTTNPLLNPFAWAKFIKDLKDFKKKKDKEKSDQRSNSNY